MAVEDGQRQVFRGADLRAQNNGLALPFAFDDDSGNAMRVFVKMRPWKGDVGSLELGPFLGGQCEGLDEDCAPADQRLIVSARCLGPGATSSKQGCIDEEPTSVGV